MYDYSSQVDNLNDEVFETDDDDETTNDLNIDDDNNDSFSSNGDYTDEDEQNNTRDLINTIKKRLFWITINYHTKYLHKHTACWLLTGEKNKLSADRLL
ncbi:unnamed protein product [Rotaria sp. Silwood1]|nr:unnamed protein product [Rotaria sp. Silwood1]